MSTGTAAVVTPPQDIGQYRIALFEELDKRAREIEEQNKSTWVELAELCATIQDNELWREGGYTSYGAWLQSACPTSRSMAYMAVGLRKELQDIPSAELRKIPLGNASILRDTPKESRNGRLLEAAKIQPPREFLGTAIEISPDSHLEQKQCHKFRLTTSQSKVLVDGFEMWRSLNNDPEAPREDVLEGIVSDYMLSHQKEYERRRS